MNNELTTIAQDLQAGNLSPHTLAEYKVKLAGWYSFYSQQLEDIMARRPVVWNALRKDLKSDKSADRAYEGTEDGIDLMRLTMLLKRIDKMTSSISSLLRLKELEARNMH